MSDDLTNSGPEDGKRISLTEAHEVAYWTKALGVTEEQLGKAVAAAGHMAEDVRIYLKHTTKEENRMMTYLMAGIYRHYKGGYYQVLGVGAHSETDERMVVYVSVKPSPGSKPLPGPRMRLRPVTMWDELVTDGSGHRVPRFKYVGFEIPADKNDDTNLPEVP